MLGRDALASLEIYAFPGNVRELENILERAITLSTGGEISASDIQLRPARGEAPGGQVCWRGPTRGSSGRYRARRHCSALEQTRYNKTAAAKALGMSFRALRYRIKKLGIE